jgi:pilus assembly protein CpaE
VAVLKENVPETILKALRSGATDFLVEPYTPEQVSAVMERVSGLFRAKGASNARVVCVVPAKGACGASTVAGSLAFQMKRTGANKVLLADLDPITGTQSFLLKLKQSYSFMDAMTRDSHLDAELWKGIIHSVQGVDVILAPDSPVHGIDDLLDPGMLLEFARTLYDVIVVDAQSPYGEWGTSIVRHSDEVLLVTSNELPALQAAQRMLSFFDRHRIDRSKVRIVVNRYSRDVGLSKEVIEAALHCEVYHVIPSDYESVQRSLVEGKPLATSAGIGKSLLAMAERLSGKESRPDEPEPSSALNGLFSFFRR